MLREEVIKIHNCTLNHLLSGDIILIGYGTLTISIPSSSSTTPPSYESSDSKATSANANTTTGGTTTTPASMLLTLITPSSTKPVFDLEITSTTMITQLQSDYLLSMPDEDLGFLRITLPNSGAATVEEREKFEQVLYSLSVAPSDLRGKLILVEEESGDVVGELTSDITVDEKLNQPDTSIPSDSSSESIVLVDIQQGGNVSVSRTWTNWVPTPNPTSSKIITLGDYVSRGIIAGADLLAQGMEKGSNTFVEKTKGTQTPLVFSTSTMKNVNIGNNLTNSTRVLSNGVIGAIGNVAGQVGSVFGSVLGIQAKPNGDIPRGIKGVVHNTLITVNAISDSLETGGKVLINAGTNASAGIIDHKFGPDAAQVTRKVGGSVKHVVLVYIDARGVTRKALLKSVGKGAVKAKMSDGREVILSNPTVENESDLDLVGRGSSKTGVEVEKGKSKGV